MLGAGVREADAAPGMPVAFWPGMPVAFWAFLAATSASKPSRQEALAE